MLERVMEETSSKANKEKIIIEVIGGLVALAVAAITAWATITAANPPQSSPSASTSITASPAPSLSSPANSPTTSPAPPVPAPTPTPTLEPVPGETGGLPYQRQDVTLGGGAAEAHVHLTPPAGPQSNFIEIGGNGFPVNSRVRIEERTMGRTFHHVIEGGWFIANFTTPADCEDYVISILTVEGEHLADLRYKTLC
jgi:hypothetical protein